MELYWKINPEWSENADKLFEALAAKAGLSRNPIRSICDDAAYQIVRACAEVCAMLLHKNAGYGNSALSPEEMIPTGVTPVQGIMIRINDKLKRIRMGTVTANEDTWLDLMGYLVLLRIAKHNEGAKEKENKELVMSSFKQSNSSGRHDVVNADK